ncbi:MAG: ribonuclease HII [Rickettsiales bacterium]|nr:ribonuclease HII [Rickettsiales bacterium]|tara:strand:+ start:1181 stop:1774 length:594 start_codon:yes stop_codon:yes gene_type:complete
MIDCLTDIEQRTIGIDEVGRGSWSGPLVACAILLKSSILKYSNIDLIDDSKKIKRNKRVELSKFIKKHSYFNFGIAYVEEIDDQNINIATKLAMERAYERFNNLNTIIKIDGKKIFEFKKNSHFLIKGDQKSIAIASASILAKVFRDQIMKYLDSFYPEYGWNSNMGYGTKKHLIAIRRFGITKFHRKSFKPIANFL